MDLNGAAKKWPVHLGKSLARRTEWYFSVIPTVECNRNFNNFLRLVFADHSPNDSQKGIISFNIERGINGWVVEELLISAITTVKKFSRGTQTLSAAYWLTETSLFLKHITEIRVSEKLKHFYLTLFCSPRHCLWLWITKMIQMKQVLFLPNILRWHQFFYSQSFQ